MTSDIAIDMDYQLLSKKGRKTTLREMILDLKARNKGLTKGLRLFNLITLYKIIKTSELMGLKVQEDLHTYLPLSHQWKGMQEEWLKD